MRLGADDHVTFQTAVHGPLAEGDDTELAATVRRGHRTRRSWRAGRRQPRGCHRCRRCSSRTRSTPASSGRWTIRITSACCPCGGARTEGHLLIVASPGSGATSGAVHTRRCGAGRGDAVPSWVYVLDGRGDERLGALAHHPRRARWSVCTSASE